VSALFSGCTCTCMISAGDDSFVVAASATVESVIVMPTVNIELDKNVRVRVLCR